MSYDVLLVWMGPKVLESVRAFWHEERAKIHPLPVIFLYLPEPDNVVFLKTLFAIQIARVKLQGFS